MSEWVSADTPPPSTHMALWLVVTDGVRDYITEGGYGKTDWSWPEAVFFDDDALPFGEAFTVLWYSTDGIPAEPHPLWKPGTEVTP